MVSEKFEPQPEKCKFCDGTMDSHKPDCSYLAVQREHQEWLEKSEEITQEFKESVEKNQITFENQMKEIGEFIEQDFKINDNSKEESRKFKSDHLSEIKFKLDKMFDLINGSNSKEILKYSIFLYNKITDFFNRISEVKSGEIDELGLEVEKFCDSLDKA